MRASLQCSIGGVLSGIGRVLEISASTRVLRERREAALRAASAHVVLGRHFLTLRGVAQHCAAETGVAFRASIDENAFVHLVAQSVKGDGRIARQVRARPGLAGPLTATLRDLYDAGVAPKDLPDRVAELRSIYRRGLHGPEALAEEGQYDRVGLFRLACRGAPAWVERLAFESIELHGATELVGSAGDLVAALSELAPLRMLQTDWASTYAAGLRETWSWDYSPEPSEVLVDPALPRDGELPEGVLRAVRASSPRAEIEDVARQILRHIESGARPRDICVVARSLEPHAPWIESVFTRFGIPFTSSLSEPLVRQPAGRLWLDLVQTLFEGLPRDATLRLLASPRLRAAADQGPGFSPQSEWLSRRAGVVRGLVDWRAACDEAPNIASEERRALDEAGVTALREAVEAIDRCVPGLLDAGDFHSAAERLIAAAERLFDSASSAEERELDERVRDSLLGLATLDDVDRVEQTQGRPERAEIRAALEAAIAGLTQRRHEADDGGVRVLDALQARALPCDHLFVIGLQHGTWPRQHREDPFLSGELRQQIREATRRPVPFRDLAEKEEHFLLGLLLSQARRSVQLSWAACDSSGHEIAPSSFLRSLPFVAPYSSVIELALPEDGSNELLDANDALTRAAGRAKPADAAEQLLPLANEIRPGDVAALRAGLALVDYTEREKASDLSYDARIEVGSLRRPDRLSPSLIEALGQCPLRALFSRLLRVPEFDAPPPDALEARERGNLLHAVLAELLTRLHRAGALEHEASLDDAQHLARQLLPECVDLCVRDTRLRLRERHPPVWSAQRDQLLAAAREFIEHDLTRILPEGLRELRVEEEFDFTLETAAGTLDMHGKPDRVLEMHGGELRVGDYKTSSNLGQLVSKTYIQRADYLQIPVYVMGSAQHFEAESALGQVLPVRPRPERDRDSDGKRDHSLDLTTAEAAAQIPLDVIAALLRDGRFPFRESSSCRHCPFDVACRKGHAASELRVKEAESFAAYFELVGDPS